MVVIAHLMVQSPVRLAGLREITDYGQNGVDLFFVLSGWLVGGLYWREQRELANVAIISFWMRRWLRTVPPYLAALLVASLGAYALRRQPFDFGYLLFVQNYYDEIPYFLFSWSLCVEEHFYLLAPLLFLALRGLTGTKGTITFLLLLAIAAPVSRLVEYPSLSNSFAYTYTASHLRKDGLVFGCPLPYLATQAPRNFHILSRIAPRAIPVLAVVLIGVDSAANETCYVLWGAIIALFFSALLIMAVSGKEVGAGIASVTGPIALTSYSLYLTHAWGLTFARNIASRFPQAPLLAYFSVAVATITILGALFYVFIERTSIQFRDTHWPRKLTLAAPGARASLRASN